MDAAVGAKWDATKLEETEDEIATTFGPLIKFLDTEGRAKLALELSGEKEADVAKAVVLLGYIGDIHFTTEDFTSVIQSDDGGPILEFLYPFKLINESVQNPYESGPIYLPEEEFYLPSTRIPEPVITFFSTDETSKALYEWYSKDGNFLKTFATATEREPSVNGLHKWMLFENVKDNEHLIQHACFQAVWPKVLEDDELLKEVKSFAKFTSVLERPLQELTFEKLKALCSLRDRDTLAAGMNSARALRGEAPDQGPINLLRELLSVSQETFGEVDEVSLAVGDALVVRLRHGVPVGEKTVEALQLRTDLHTSCQRLLGDDHKLTLTAKRMLALEFKRFGNLEKAKRMLQAVIPKIERAFGSTSDEFLLARLEFSMVTYEVEGELIDRRDRHYNQGIDDDDEYLLNTDAEESGIESADSDFEVLEANLGK